MKNGQQEISNTLLHHDASPATLIFVLKFMFAIWLVRYSIDPLQQISLLPIEYSNPVGWMKLLPLPLFEAMHSFGGLCLLRATIVGACIGVWIPRLRMPSALMGCVLITTACAITRGFGHINHADIGPLLVTWVLTVFALRLPIDSVRKPGHEFNSTASSGMVLATLVLSLVYALVGIARLANGGIEVLAGDTITNRMVHMSHHDWLIDFNLSSLLLSSPLMLLGFKLGFAVVTVVEIATPFSLISRRVRMLVLLFMPAFHVGAFLLFKVVFIEQALALILLVNLTPMLARRNDNAGWLTWSSVFAFRPASLQR